MKLALLNSDKKIYPVVPIGLTSIATYLEKYLGMKDIRVIDINFENYMKELSEFNPDVVGISTITENYYVAIEIAENIKQKMNVPIIVGGPHISTLPSSLKKCFDIGVMGEGEETMLELMKLLQSKKKFKADDLKKVKGIVFRNKGKLAITMPRPLMEDINIVPIDDKKYVNKVHLTKKTFFSGEHAVLYPILTARGCPFTCLFCATPILWKITRYYSAERVVREIKELYDEYNIRFFKINDGTFTINKPRLRKIIRLLKKEKLLGKVKFHCLGRTDLIDKEMLLLIQKIGVIDLSFGFESGSPRILRFLKDNTTTVEDTKRAVLLCRKYCPEINISGDIIMGAPTERIEDMKMTVDLIRFLRKNDVWVTLRVMTAYPGTKMWEIARERGKVSNDMDFKVLYQININHPLLLDEDIPINEFKKVFYEAGREINKKWRKTVISEYVIRHPISVFKYILTSPIKALKLINDIFIEKISFVKIKT